MTSQPQAMDPASGNLVLTIQAFLVQTRHHTIVVDTCVGDHKPRPHRPIWDRLQLNTFLPGLAAVGVSPADVDYVMCTHLHWDHVGWNTQLQDGRWVPTFPQAKYIFAKCELEAWEAVHEKEPQSHYIDSILPIVEAGQVRLSTVGLRVRTNGARALKPMQDAIGETGHHGTLTEQQQL